MSRSFKKHPSTTFYYHSSLSLKQYKDYTNRAYRRVQKQKLLNYEEDPIIDGFKSFIFGGHHFDKPGGRKYIYVPGKAIFSNILNYNNSFEEMIKEETEYRDKLLRK